MRNENSGTAETRSKNIVKEIDLSMYEVLLNDFVSTSETEQRSGTGQDHRSVKS